MTSMFSGPPFPEHADNAVIDAGRFDPSSAENSWTLPAVWYTDPTVFEHEQKRLFAKAWTYIGHRTDIRGIGDYMTAEVAGQSIFVTRAADGVLRAFYNVCSHRAHPLVEGVGTKKIIACPYHQWCYTPDGRFRGARGRAEIADWIPENADLKPVQLEEYAGLLFVNLDPNAAPLAGQSAKLREAIGELCPELEGMSRVYRAARAVAANWKTVIDNNHECYHCTVNHPALMDLMNYSARADWSDDGISFIHKIIGFEPDNAPYGIQDGTSEDSLFSFIFPTTIPLFFPGTGGAVIFAISPTGPETCTISHDFYFPDGADKGKQRQFIDYITKTLAAEDMALCEKVQIGLRSNGYRQGKFVVDRNDPGYSEHHVHFFQALVHKALTS